MGRFEFRSKVIELDFAGIKTAVPASMEFANKLKEVANKMTVWGNDPANEHAGTEEAKDFILDILDELLGEEVMDRIEAERELELYDCIDMFTYINNEVASYHESKIKTYAQHSDSEGAQPMAMVTENRAMRRAKRRRK